MRSFAIPAAVVAVCVFAAVSLAEEAPPSISTNGESIVYVTPDEVIVSFGIETFDADLDKAKSLNDERAAKLVQAIKGLGIEAKHIQTDNLMIELSYRSNRPWEGIAGYFARRAYSVRLKDVKLFEKLIDTGLKNGANQLQGFSFRTTELRKYRDQARSMAAKAAREKAETLAKDLDCSVGRPRQISEGYVGFYGGYMGRMNAMAQNSVQFTPAPASEEMETMPLGQIAVQAQISVTFDLK